MTVSKQALRSDLTTAIKAQDELRMATLRMLLAAVSNAEVAGKTARELTQADVVEVLAKEVKKRRESACAFRAGNRPELADREEAELAVIGEYLPRPLTQGEVTELVNSAVAKAAAAGKTGPAAMGVVMKDVSPQVAGRFDGAELAKLVRTKLSAR